MSNYQLPSVSTISSAVAKLRGVKMVRPAGTLAGHSVGTLVEGLVGEVVTTVLGDRVKRPHDAMNEMLMAHVPCAVTKRRELFGPASAQELLVTGRALPKWRTDRPFGEAQGATADFLLFRTPKVSFSSGDFSLLDAKSVNQGVAGMNPNIISARKLFSALWRALAEGEVPFDLLYAVVGYHEVGAELVIDSTRVVSLFLIDSPLYINWTAGSQIQFDPFSIDQSFSGSKLDWCEAFLAHYLEEWDRDMAREAQAREIAGQRVEMATSR